MRFNLIYSLAAMGLLACYASKNTGQGLPVSPENIVIAHRGAFKKANHPENSIASLETAIRLKCAGSEFDVRMTSDDSLIINHDPDFRGLEIEKSTYAELLKFPLSNGE